MNKLILAASLITLLSGCATVKDAKDAKGTGAKAEFEASYNEAWNASVKIIEESNLDLLSENKELGEILAQKGLSFASYGENVAMFLSEKDQGTTEVEVVSKKALATNVFARDWSVFILDKLRELFPEVKKPE